MDLTIFPPAKLPQSFTPQLPLSKSISNRRLILDALTPGASTSPVAVCDDTRALTGALSTFSDTVNIGAAGTAMRFYTAYAAATPGLNVTVDGTERMRQRPIGPLVDALRNCGASIDYVINDGYPPVSIHGTKLHGGHIDIDAGISSQYISALLMIAPTMTAGLTIHLNGDAVSTPYIYMTIEMMRRRGIKVTVEADGHIHIPPGTYLPDSTPVEPDWSAASYWLEFSGLSGCDISLQADSTTSLQGDSVIVDIMKSITSTTGAFAIDMTKCPDLAQTVAATLAIQQRPFRITGLKTLRIKETDRLAAMQAELSKIGIIIDIIGDDTLVYDGKSQIIATSAVFDTYHDHRMAMSLAFVSLRIPGITIKDAGVVSKSYPGFWDDMRRVGFKLVQTS